MHTGEMPWIRSSYAIHSHERRNNRAAHTLYFFVSLSRSGMCVLRL